LEKLLTQTFPRDEFEIVVADNGSPEVAELRSVVEGKARLVVVDERGAGPARNGGVAVANGEILAFIDSDCQADPEWLAEGVAALSSYDFVGGRVRVLVEDQARMTPTEAFESVFAFDFKSYVTRKGFAGAGNLFCPHELFERVGGYRSVVSEDVDWSGRARAAGYRIGFAPKAIVGHPARRTWRQLHAKWRRINAEMYHLATERSAGALWWFLRTLLLPASALAHSPRVVFSRELKGLDQRIAALGVLYRLRFWRFGDSLRLMLGGAGR
jgi:glycosyltransferase involved in cell wall biosynthesis